MHHIRHEARRLVAAGPSVIPIRRDGTKGPALDTWRPYQRVPPNAVMLASWFRHGEGLAVIGGAVSGHVVVLDFDAPELFAPWCALVERLCPGLVARLPLVRTPSDGRHLYYRCQIMAGNLKLAQRLGARGTPETVIETRGEGGIRLLHPHLPRAIPYTEPT
jgi:Bifunctional DNA primase/polymerase, N-terminal